MEDPKRVYATLAPGRKQAALFSEVDLGSALRRVRMHPDKAKLALWVADSDEAGRVFRFQAGQHSNMKPATVPI